MEISIYLIINLIMNKLEKFISKLNEFVFTSKSDCKSKIIKYIKYFDIKMSKEEINIFTQKYWSKHYTNISDEIKIFRNLMKQSNIVKEYIKDSKNQLNIDWETNIKQNPDKFKFVNKKFFDNNTDGSPITFFIFKPNEYKNVCIVTREEDSNKDFYDNHICYSNSKFNINDISKFLASNKFKILAVDFCTFKKLDSNKFRYFDDPYYKFDIAKEQRLEKTMEYKICNIILDSIKNINDLQKFVNSINDGNSYKSFMKNIIKIIIENPKFKTVYQPITWFDFIVRDFELDFKRKRAYLEGTIQYKYIDDKGNEKLDKYGTILPNFNRFQKSINILTTYDALLASIYDSILQIFNAFSQAILDNKKRMMVSNIVSAGFNQDLLQKFKTL